MSLQKQRAAVLSYNLEEGEGKSRWALHIENDIMICTCIYVDCSFR